MALSLFEIDVCLGSADCRALRAVSKGLYRPHRKWTDWAEWLETAARALVLSTTRGLCASLGVPAPAQATVIPARHAAGLAEAVEAQPRQADWGLLWDLDADDARRRNEAAAFDWIIDEDGNWLDPDSDTFAFGVNFTL